MERTGWISDFSTMERMYSVRFVSDTAFVTTVNQTAPFYIADLSNTDPSLVGTLDLPALSNQLHPIDQRGQGHILAVGEEVDGLTGLPVGLSFAHVDMSDISNPRLMHSLGESTTGAEANAQVQFDYRNSLYLDELEILLLPVSIVSYTDDSTGFFKGFRVYEFDTEAGITYRFDIGHAGDSDEVWGGCFSDARVSARAIVDLAAEDESFLVTVNMHSAAMTNMRKEDKLWSLNFDADRDEEMCYSY